MRRRARSAYGCDPANSWSRCPRTSSSTGSWTTSRTIDKASGVRRRASTLRVGVLVTIAGSLLLAFGLRVERLDFQSLWYDEGSSIYLARQSLSAITAGAANDIHPPLYYYLLHFWMGAAGQSEYGVRFLSAITGVLIVVLLFALGRLLAGQQVGVLATLAGTVSPLLVYYSQETRMYAQ